MKDMDRAGWTVANQEIEMIEFLNHQNRYRNSHSKYQKTTRAIFRSVSCIQVSWICEPESLRPLLGTIEGQRGTSFKILAKAWNHDQAWNNRWWKKSCTSWHWEYPIVHEVSYITGGAGCLPPTVSLSSQHISKQNLACNDHWIIMHHSNNVLWTPFRPLQNTLFKFDIHL